MMTFSGTEYLKIDIANCFGLDKETWNNRLDWVAANEPDLETLDGSADSPILYRKAVRALRTVQQGAPNNHIMGLDATASGLQIMGALSGCYNTAKAVNLVNTGRREDVYGAVAHYMNTIPGIKVDRATLKKPIMTTFYGSTEQPKAVFGEGPELIAYYQALREKLTGAYDLMGIFQSYWNPFVEYHQWTLPDGHVAKVPVTETVEKSLEIDEFDHMRFAYRASLLHPKAQSRALAANIVHSIDGWIVRMMVRAAEKQGFWLAPIHDCFYTSPNYMDQVRQNYLTIMQWIAKSNLVSTILTELCGNPVAYNKYSYTLHHDIAKAEYALS
jgi:DNA-directed RNA polymerase